MKKTLFLLALALHSCAEPRPRDRFNSVVEMPTAHRANKYNMFQSVLVTDETEKQDDFLPATPQNKIEVIEVEVGIILGSASGHCDMLRLLHKGKKENAIAYVERYAHLAYRIQILYSIPAEIVLAQAMVESGFGESNICKGSNNHFSIRFYKGDSWDRQQEGFFTCENNRTWRRYANISESYYDYGEYMQENCPNLFLEWRGHNHITPAKIAKTGYAGKTKAEQKSYQQQLENIIFTYRLKQLFQ